MENSGSDIVVRTETKTSEMNRTERIGVRRGMVRALHFEKQLWSFFKILLLIIKSERQKVFKYIYI